MAYTTREIGQILGIPPYMVRYYARKGLGRSGQGRGRYYRFSFQELLLFKTICRLLFHGISLRRIRRIMKNLPHQISTEDSVTAVSIWADGGRVLARHSDSTWDPESGQEFFNFERAMDSANVSRLEEYRSERIS